MANGSGKRTVMRINKDSWTGTPLYRRTLPASTRRMMHRMLDMEQRQDDAAREAFLAEEQEPDLLEKRKIELAALDMTFDTLQDLPKLTGSIQDFLPFMFRIKGKTAHLKDHFYFEPFFNLPIPPRRCAITARQVGKSQQLMMLGLLLARLQPHFQQLFLTPLFEMIRRLSSNYTSDLINSSPVKNLFQDQRRGNVLQRDLPNLARLLFSFARTDAGRTRGLNIDYVHFDEIQDTEFDVIQIIQEALSGSDFGWMQFFGTPKSMGNTGNRIYEQSSQARWIIPCRSCGHWSIPSLDEDLDRMLGPLAVDRFVSEEAPGVVCGKCSKPISPREGMYYHFFPDRKHSFPGYHIPQMISPKHYAKQGRWLLLQAKRMGFNGVSTPTFYNEVCGIAYDAATLLISQAELRKAATLHVNKLEEAIKARKTRGYKMVVMGVDWGGNGQDFSSLTAVAVVGILPTGVCEVIYGWRAPTMHDYVNEISMIVHIAKSLGVSHIADDLGGGTSRSEFLKFAGLSEDRICSTLYIAPCRGAMMRKIPFNPRTGLRTHYQLEKTRSLISLCELIRSGFVRFFRYDYRHAHDPGLLNDFTSLIENQQEVVRGSNVLTIMRDSKVGPDDFANATNVAVHLLYFLNGRQYPTKVQETIKAQIEEAIARKLNPDRMDFDFSVMEAMMTDDRD